MQSFEASLGQMCQDGLTVLTEVKQEVFKAAGIQIGLRPLDRVGLTLLCLRGLGVAGIKFLIKSFILRRSAPPMQTLR